MGFNFPPPRRPESGRACGSGPGAGSLWAGAYALAGDAPGQTRHALTRTGPAPPAILGGLAALAVARRGSGAQLALRASQASHRGAPPRPGLEPALGSRLGHDPLPSPPP